MKVEEISFDDEAFKAAVLASGESEAEAVTEINGRKRHIRSTTGIECLPNLRVLDLTRNQLSQLDLSGNPKLEQLFVGNNQLEELDVSVLPELEGLEIFMNDIETLDLSKNAKLEVLYANANDFEELDLSNNPLLEDVQINDNRLREVLLPDAKNMLTFSAQNNLFSAEKKSLLQGKISGCKIVL